MRIYDESEPQSVQRARAWLDGFSVGALFGFGLALLIALVIQLLQGVFQ